MKKITLILALSLGIFLSLAHAQSASPDLGAFTIEPASPNSIVPWKIILENKPGDTVKNSVILTNNTKKIIELNLDVVDEIYQDNQKIYTTNNKEEKSVGIWGTIENNTILQAYEEKQIEYSLSIPADTEPGEYKGAITATKIGEYAGSIRKDLRILAPIQLTVTDDPQPIPLQSTAKDAQANAFTPTPFFWGTIAVFLSSMLYIVISKRKEKKSNK